MWHKYENFKCFNLGNNFYSVVAKSTTFLPTNSKLTNQHETKKTQKCKCRQKHRILFLPSKNPPPSHCPTRPSRTSSSTATPRPDRQLHGVGTRTDRQRTELERIGNLGVAWLVFRPRARPQPHGRIGNSMASELERIGKLGVAWLVFRSGVPTSSSAATAGSATRSVAAGPLRALAAWSGLGGTGVVWPGRCGGV
jgi:hypothetical protein